MAAATAAAATLVNALAMPVALQQMLWRCLSPAAALGDAYRPTTALGDVYRPAATLGDAYRSAALGDAYRPAADAA